MFGTDRMSSGNTHDILGGSVYLFAVGEKIRRVII